MSSSSGFSPTMKAPLKERVAATFTGPQWRNIILYAFGIMCYKFALEWYNGSFITQANERFGSRANEMLGVLTGTNYAAQCIGSICVAPLIKKFKTRTVLACAVAVFSLVSTLPLICDAASGGVPKYRGADGKTQYGSWSPYGLIPIYIVSGFSYGTVELIRRVIPRDIVGGEVVRLKKMDALVHVMYEVAGTAGAFSSTALIGRMGYNYSAFLSPILFAFAGTIWIFVAPPGDSREASPLARVERQKEPIYKEVYRALHAFIKALWYGGYLVMTNRKLIWLAPSYTLALYLHRYLENALAPLYAKNVLGNSSWSQIIVGGSNAGELLGALSVMVLATKVPSPIPWLRLDALNLLIVWVLPFFPSTWGAVSSAWRLAAIFLPISYGWAAGDVSLSAYVQSFLSKLESVDPEVSALGAVMSFLYVSYIILYSIVSTVVGKWVDGQLRPYTGTARVEPTREVLKKTAGVHFTIVGIVIFASTFIPKGAFALNPKMIDGKDCSEEDVEEDDESYKEGEAKEGMANKKSLDGVAAFA